MTGLPFAAWMLPPDLRPDAPNGWLVIAVGPGTGVDGQGNLVQIPELQSLHPIEFLDDLEGTLRRLRRALAREKEDHLRREAAMQRAAGRMALRRAEVIMATGSVRDGGTGTVTHLAVAQVAEGSEERRAAEVLVSPARNDVGTMRRLLERLRDL